VIVRKLVGELGSEGVLSGSGEKSPQRKIELSHERNCHVSSPNFAEILVLATIQTGINSSTLSGNEINMQNDA
jgi:hypothetical protein